MLWLHRQNFEVLRLPGLAQTCPTLVVTGTDWRGMPARLDVTNHLCQGGLLYQTCPRLSERGMELRVLGRVSADPSCCPHTSSFKYISPGGRRC